MKRKLIFLVKRSKFILMKNKNIIWIVGAVLLFTGGPSLWSQEESRIKDFYSPYFISGTASSALSLAPQSDSINPASSALVQRVTLDLNYLGIIGSEGAVDGYKGHGINIGTTFPTKAGVFSWSGHYLYSPYPSINSNSVFSLNGSFSKDLYPDFLVGAGIKLAASLDPGFSAGLDLGVISLNGTVGIFKDFRWAVVLQDLGYSGITSTFPDPFTLTGSFSGNLLKTTDFTLGVSSDISFPGFKSVLLTLGGNLNFRDTISLNLGTRFDLDALIKGNPYGMIPSIGFNYSFKTDIKDDSAFPGLNERGWNKSEVNIQSGFAPISEKLWALGLGVNIPLGLIDKTPPVIELDISGFETEPLPGDSPAEESKEAPTDSTVGKLPVKGYSGKGGPSSPVTVSSGNHKVTESKSTAVKPAAEVKSTYKGIYDKRYPDSGIAFYISPNNDGIRDSLTFPINISDSRYLSGYAFLIKDSQGTIVREIRNKEKRIENQGFKGFFDRLFSVKSQIEIPSEFRWDGLDNKGGVVEDGLYFFSVEAWDDNGNRGSSDSYAIVVDAEPPSVEITEPEDENKIFSPNNDGNKDTITIVQKGSDEDLWKGAIIDSSGTSVRTLVWEDSVPEDFIWDGRNNEGILVPDGVYSYQIESRDRSGNSTLSGFSNIIKNTEETPITLSIDKSYFSPNNDKILDSLLFSPDIPVTDGIISWSLAIVDKNGSIRRLFSGKERSPDSMIFDGRDQDGIILEEGEYSGRIEVVYLNGNNPKADSPLFFIDITSPAAKVKSSNSVFSPNGDGLKDEISFYQESTMETLWSGVVRSSDGAIVNEYQWPGAAEPVVVWNGTLSDGRLAPDGDYTYQLISIDRAGNTGKSEIVEFSLDTEATPVILTTDLHQFSPNGDSEKDTIAIIPEIKVKEGIDSYSLNILDSNNNIVRNFSGKNSIPDKFIWNGIGDSGRRVEDGEYSSYLTIVYKKGNSPTARSSSFIIDTVFPEIKAEADFLLFSPDSDGNKDSIGILQRSSTEDIWYGNIFSESGDVVKSYVWKKNTIDIKWDGTDNEGNPVPDGFYSYSVYSVDAAGNRSSAEIDNIEVDTRPTAIFLTVKDKYLSPTGNGFYEDLTFSTIVNNKTGLESWSLKIFHETRGLLKEFTGEKSIPKNIIWNGVDKNGKITEGYYYAEFSVLYEKGNKPEVSSSRFLVDISAPRGSMRLSPVPFSPDNDGVDDDISININVNDLSGIKRWDLNIFDPEKRIFKTYSGIGNPSASIIWDGKSSTGELVYAAMDYPVELTLEDKLGNISVYKDKIPVDVLVVREGNILKIKIANIIFQKNSPLLLADTPEVVEQNKFILKRISELLKKYSSYKITVEGHAVVTKWYDPAAAKIEEEKELKPLSEQRALTVMNYLSRLGVDPSRMDSKGMGGSNPIVPNSDLENRWKNRRVEFILWKE